MRFPVFSIAALLLVPAASRAQPERPLATVDDLAASVAVRADTLRRAHDLPVDEMQRQAIELDDRVDALVDETAPYPSLAQEAPAIRARTSALVRAATNGDSFVVESTASRLAADLRDLRARTHNLEVPPESTPGD